MRPRFQAALFDFDYTLADSSDAIISCFNAGLAGLGLPAAESDAIRRTIGMSIPESLALVAGEEHRARADEFREHWRRRSDRIMVDWTRMLDPAADAVKQLHDSGLRLGVVSTKWRQRIVDVLAREGLLERFEVVVGGDDVSRLKPDPEGLKTAVERLELRPADVVYVGDSVVDGEAAWRAGFAFIGVLSGVASAGELRRFEPLAIVDHVGELPGFLRRPIATLPG